MISARRSGRAFAPPSWRSWMRTSGLTLKELASALDLSPRSLQRRRSSGRLERHESDRLYRLARIVAIANVYLGDRERALRWLRHPNRRSPESPLWRQSTPNSVHARWRTSWAGFVWRNQLGRVYRNQKSQNPHPATLASLPLSYCASDQLFTLHLQVSPVFICRNMPLLRPSNYERRRI